MLQLEHSLCVHVPPTLRHGTHRRIRVACKEASMERLSVLTHSQREKWVLVQAHPDSDGKEYWPPK